jgi:hypothetical protein
VAQAIVYYFMVIKPSCVRDSRGKLYVCRKNILEIAAYQADGTHSELYKITVGLCIQFALDEAEAEH